MENSFERHTEDYCVIILCCNCILSPYALITRFLKRKKKKKKKKKKMLGTEIHLFRYSAIPLFFIPRFTSSQV